MCALSDLPVGGSVVGGLGVASIWKRSLAFMSDSIKVIYSASGIVQTR